MCGKVSIQLVLMVAGPIQGSGSALGGWAPLDGQHFSSPPLPSLFPSGFRTVTNLDEHPPSPVPSLPLESFQHSLVRTRTCTRTRSLGSLLPNSLVKILAALFPCWWSPPYCFLLRPLFSLSSPLILLEQLLDPSQLLHLRGWSQTVLPASSHPG